MQRLGAPKKRVAHLRAGTSCEEIWACAAAAYCYAIKHASGSTITTRSGHTIHRKNKPQYDDFRRAHLPRGVRPEPDLLMGDSLVFQYDGRYYHSKRAESDARTNRKHAQQGFRVIRLRDRLGPVPGCDNILCDTPNVQSVQKDIFAYFGAEDQHTPAARAVVADWARRRMDELSRSAEGRDPGLSWLRKQIDGTGVPFDDRWRCIPFEEPNVRRAHRSLLQSVGKCAYVSAMRTPLFGSLHLSPVWKEVNWWVETLGAKRFSTLMGRHSVASGLERPAFRSRLRNWVDYLGPQHFTAWACNSVASRLERPAFNRAVRRWLDELGPELLAKWMCDGVASRIERPEFNRAARAWLARLSQKFGRAEGRPCFAAWMNNCVARRLNDPAFDRVAREWLGLVDCAPHYVTIFHGCFVSRLHCPRFDARARGALRQMGGSAFIAFLNRNRGRKLDGLFL